MSRSHSELAELARYSVLGALDDFSKSGKGRAVHLEEGKDIKLEADLFLSERITERLAEATGIPCLSEEDTAKLGLPEKEAMWIVDPLDGSMNFTREIPLHCISIALWQESEPRIGLIHDQERDVTFTAADGISMRDGEPMAVRSEQDISRAMLATGFPRLMDTSGQSVDWFLRFADKFKKVRMIGSAALSLAWVADGRMDAYFERDIMIWDVAAGLALVRGAGGVCHMKPGNHPHSYDVLAANAFIAESMCKELEW